MAELSDTDRYDPARNGFKQCMYCQTSTATGSGSTTVGLCNRHLNVFQEDIAGGFKQNRLKSLMDAYEDEQRTPKPAPSTSPQLSLF